MGKYLYLKCKFQHTRSNLSIQISECPHDDGIGSLTRLSLLVYLEMFDIKYKNLKMTVIAGGK